MSLKALIAGFSLLVFGGAISTSARATTVTFDAAGPVEVLRPSYTEAGLTFSSVHPDPSRHLHLGDFSGDRSPDLLNHPGFCCSTPYVIASASVPFDLHTVDIVLNTLLNPSTFMTDRAGHATVDPSTPLGSFAFPELGFSGVRAVTWNIPGPDGPGGTGALAIDNVAFSVIPEPTTLLLFGTTAAGLGLARWKQRRRGKQQP